MKKNHQTKAPIIRIKREALKAKTAHLENLGLDELFANYESALRKELEMRQHPIKTPEILYSAEKFYNIACTILEVAENNTALRCCAKNGHVTDEEIAFESVGAHANLASEITDAVLDILYGWGNDTPRYTRYEFAKALRYHDLPENETGDSEDNLTRNETAKAMQEDDYFDTFSQFFVGQNDMNFYYVKTLLQEMRDLSSEEGRIIYLADKLAAVIMVLCYQRLKVYMYALKTDPSVSPINLEEIKMCDESYQGGYLFSEMWTNDFLYARELTKFDDSGIFTAILIMVTLICRDNRWYHWRMTQQKL